ncbi:MAG: transglutaminase family protein [SAR324 cluster bacterium]|nr:transglutaminase family protein [SAR324 cluster bacterium]
MTQYQVTHQTQYQYKKEVARCHNVAHLIPRNFTHQQCLDVQISILPQANVCLDRLDYFGNQTTYFDIQDPHTSLTVTFQSTVDVKPRSLPSLEQSPNWEWVQESLRQAVSPEDWDAAQFVFESPNIPLFRELKDYAAPSFFPGRPFLEAVMDLTHRIYTDFTFDPKATTVSTPIAKVLKKRRGVCQDFTHLAIACLRSYGLAARYISGYLESIPPPGKPKLVGSDVSHAWFSAYSPSHGWVDFDPTNDLMPNQQHITTAWGRDYSDISPLKGILFGGGDHKLQVSVDVMRMNAN